MAEGEECYQAIVVKVVDILAAGDAFNGALAASFTEGMPLAAAMK